MSLTHLSKVLAVLCLAGGTVAVAGPASATTTVTCPKVNPTTGVVTPAPTPGVDWSGCDLANANLNDAALTGANLSGANLNNTMLHLAALQHANMTGATLFDADLANAFLNDAALVTANLGGADQQYADLQGANLTGATLTASNMSDVTATDANFTDANLGAASLSAATLTGANLSGAQLDNVTLQYEISGGITGTPASFPVNYSLAGGYLIGPYSDLAGADLAGLNLTGADLSGADLTGADLNATILTGANLYVTASGGITGTPLLPANWVLVDGYLAGPGADLANVNLTGIDLAGLDLAGAFVDRSNLTNANLSGTDLAGADLDYSILTGASVGGAQLTAALLNVTSGQIAGTPTLPADWLLVNGYLVGPEANLAGADLAGQNLANAQLGDANLTGANLSGANMTDVDLYYARLAGANLSGATLTVAAARDMYYVRSGNVTGTAAVLPTGWMLVGGYLEGPYADLDRADLSGASLSGADLAHAILAQASLTGASLSAANLYSADLDQADLTGANLSAATAGFGQFVSADLANSNLDGTNLDGANVDYANLSGASYDSLTNWTSLFWYNTTCPDGSNSNAYLDGCFSAKDTTPPAAAPKVTSGTLGNDGWYISPVTVTWNWTDDGTVNTGDCTQTSGAARSGNPVTLTATCADLAGNIGHAAFPVKIDLAPSVSVTGIRPRAVYALGRVPAIRCRTIDMSGVAVAASLTVRTTGQHGVGRFTASCAGAVGVAGDRQSGSAAVSYFVAYGFRGFRSPWPGSTIATYRRTITVTFQLGNAAGRPLPGYLARPLAVAGRVRVTLTGPHIWPVRASCGWVARTGDFSCLLRIPAGVRIGRGYQYRITAAENVGAGFQNAPRLGKAVNPEIIHFDR